MTTEARLHSHEAEQAVLGSILRDGRTLDDVAELIPDPGSFYGPAHRSIYHAIQTLSGRNASIDPISVGEELGKNLPNVGGSTYLIEITDSVPSTSIASRHARIILKYHTIRELLEASERIRQKCAEAPDPEELQDFAESQITQVSLKHREHSESQIAEGLDNLYAGLDKADIGGVETKYPPIDRIIGRLKNSELTIIAGRPSMGKTALCLNIAQNLTVDHNIPVGFISLEMDKESMQKRILSPIADVPVSSMNYKGMDDGRWTRLTLAGQKISSIPLYIADPPSMTMFQIRSTARRLKLSHNIRLLIIDYLQLIAPLNPRLSHYERASDTSRLLKALARELKIPVVAVSQLSREVDKRNPPRPQLSDLRDSGSLEQDAADVLFVYRPGYYLKHAISTGDAKAIEIDARGDTKIIVAKQRNGPTGDADLYYHREVCRFETFERNSLEERL